MLFPVFTLSTNFPIIAITLRNNLKGLCLREGRRYSFFTTRCLFPILAILPPTVVGLLTSDVEILVGITGAYAGSFIQVRHNDKLPLYYCIYWVVCFVVYCGCIAPFFFTCFDITSYPAVCGAGYSCLLCP